MSLSYEHSRKWSNRWRGLKEKVKKLPDPRKQKIDGLALHDRLHLLIAQMAPIEIGGHWVDGISGLNIDFFNHPPNFIPQYDGVLDELRVAIHELIVIPSWISVVRYLEWCRIMLVSGINPVWVTYQHYWSYKNWLNQGNYPNDLPKAQIFQQSKFGRLNTIHSLISADWKVDKPHQKKLSN